MTTMVRRPIVLLFITLSLLLTLYGQSSVQSVSDPAIGLSDQLTLRKPPQSPEDLRGGEEHATARQQVSKSPPRAVDPNRSVAEAAPKQPPASEPREISLGEARIRGVRPAAGSNRPATRVVGYAHRVVDGDTLRSLAARYLGSEERYQELFDANRDVLSHPDLLPLGTTLRLPSLEPH